MIPTSEPVSLEILSLARRLLAAALALACLASVLWVIGFLWFAVTIPDHVEDSESVTDAVIVLTGGSERLDEGLALLAAGKARKLFISGVHPDVDVSEILRIVKSSPPHLACCIVLGYVADSTIGNAAETAAWVKGQGYRSLRLVTASYHMRRSLMEFTQAIPGVDIIPHPVFPDSVKQAEWWLWPGTAYLIAREYTKYLLAALRLGAEKIRAGS